MGVHHSPCLRAPIALSQRGQRGDVDSRKRAVSTICWNKWSGTCQSRSTASRWSMEAWSPPLGIAPHIKAKRREKVFFTTYAVTALVPSWFMGVHHSPCLRAPIATVAAAANEATWTRAPGFHEGVYIIVHLHCCSRRGTGERRWRERGEASRLEPRELHIHCYSDSLQHARDLCERWPNLRIGFTGADTFRDPPGRAKGKGKGGSGSGSGHGHGRGLAEVLAPSTGAVLA